MSFRKLLEQAKQNDPIAIERLLEMYRPLLLRESIVSGIFDEDLYQELCIVFLHCVKQFRT